MSVLVLNAEWVAAAVGGRVVSGEAARVFGSVSIDTRTITPGALFVAIRGERFDGHAFAPEAVARGATGLLVDTAAAAVPGTAVILVEDTTRALQALGREIRRASGARVVAITGSAGKTSTKELCADLLASRYRVFRNRGNLNNHIGLPLSLIELADGPDVAVVELGMNHAGEIRTLAGIAEPDVRVWTNVGDAHIGHFGSREAVAAAKAELLEGATARTTIIANADDPLVMAHVGGSPARVITYGEAAGATVRAIRIVDRGFEGTEAEVRTPGPALRLHVPLPGRAQLMNALAATAVALLFEVSPHAIETRLALVRPVPRRGALTRRADGTRVIDDSYNASPAATAAMLASLAATPTGGRRVAVLGEMLELGDHSEALHRETGRRAAAAGLDVIVTVGGAAGDALADGARRAGFDPACIHSFPDSAAAVEGVRALVRPGDLVLVKGSRGSRMDVIADRLAGGA